MILSPVLKQRFFDANGLPLASGQLFSYAAGTTTPQATYSNATGTANSNPVVLDSSGYADVWIDPTLAYKFVLEDANNNVIFTEDNVTFPLSVTTWSANITYSQGAIVADSSGQGLFYVSLVNNNTNNALTDVSAWRLLGGNVRTLSTNSSLAITDDLIRSNSTSGSLTHTLPAISTTPIGKRITVKDIGTGGNTTSVKGSGTDLIDGSNTYSTALSSDMSGTFENNGTTWDAIGFVSAGSVTQAMLAERATGSTVAAGGVASSSSTGSLSFLGATTFTAVTNASVTITTTGRPVKLMFLPDGASNANNSAVGVGTAAAFYVDFYNATNTASVMTHYLSGSGAAISTFIAIDLPAAGTYNYTVRYKASSGDGNITYMKLIAYEI